MIDEGLATTIVIGGITGAGLLLAVYALMTPLIEKMFLDRSENIRTLKQEFLKMASKLNIESTKQDLNDLSLLKKEITSLSKFPRYLREVVIVDFTLFIITAFFEGAWLLGNRYSDLVFGTIVPILFLSAIIIFGFVGLYAFGDVSDWMKKEFEKATADKAEVEKAFKVASGNIVISGTAEVKNVETRKEEDKTQN